MHANFPSLIPNKEIIDRIIIPNMVIIPYLGGAGVGPGVAAGGQ